MGGSCVYGGTRIDAGLDTNDDSVLQAGEITSTQYVCNASATWSEVTGDTQAAPNFSYVASSTSRLRFTLPSTPQVGDIIAISGAGLGGWEITPNVGQSIVSSTISSLAVASNEAQAPLYGAQYASIQLQYIGGDQFMPLSYIGSISNGFLSQGGLTWSPAKIGLEWGAANSYCAGTINGTTGWRLPTLAELDALAASGQQRSGGWRVDYTWTSTAGAPGHWGVVTGDGRSYPFSDTYPGAVTCVK